MLIAAVGTFVDKYSSTKKGEPRGRRNIFEGRVTHYFSWVVGGRGKVFKVKCYTAQTALDRTANDVHVSTLSFSLRQLHHLSPQSAAMPSSKHNTGRQGSQPLHRFIRCFLLGTPNTGRLGTNCWYNCTAVVIGHVTCHVTTWLSALKPL
jgi:hypothetical protein